MNWFKKLLQRLFYWAVPELKGYDMWIGHLLTEDGPRPSIRIQENHFGFLKYLRLPKIECKIITPDTLPDPMEYEVWYVIDVHYERKTVLYGTKSLVESMGAAR